MKNVRERESEAMVKARAELRGIVEDFRVAKVRALALARRLKGTARTATPVAIAADGEVFTVEKWMGAEIQGWAGEELAAAVKFLADVARSDRRAEIEEWVRDSDEGERKRRELQTRVRALVGEIDHLEADGKDAGSARAEFMRLTEDEVPMHGRLVNPRRIHLEYLGLTKDEYCRLRNEAAWDRMSPMPAMSKTIAMNLVRALH